MDKITLGFNIGHDQGAALIKNGKIVAAIAQERIDRIKHSYSVNLPFQAIDALLKYCNIDITDVSCFGFSSTAVNIQDLKSYVEDSLKKFYHLTGVCSVPVPHHLAHAASTYYTSDFDEAVVLIADGGGEMLGEQEESESIFICKKGKIELAEQRLQSNLFHALYRPHNYLYPFMNKKQATEQISLGKKYEQISNLIGFGGNGAGKTMGLSAYGVNQIDTSPAPVEEPFSFYLDCQFVLQQYFALYERSGENYFDFMEKHKANIARTIQDYTENQILEIVKYILNKYKTPNLCLAGGLFLNCPVNHKIIEAFPDVAVHICPAAGDDGQAIGAAFIGYQTLFSPILPSSKPLPYLGIDYSNAQIENALSSRNIPFHYYDDSELVDLIAMQIHENMIVGLLHGRSEIGPRALCHRSILANPTNPNMKDYINDKVKHRESFRPFAPVVTSEQQFDFFSLIQESPYMLFAAQVKHPYAQALPAITHVDGTARVQAISKKDNPFVHGILKKFEKLSGYPILLNTSFNDFSEPIVESPDDAIRTFLLTEIDVLVMENYVVFKDEITTHTL